MGYGRQSRQNRKENPIRNWTFRLHKMQKNLPHNAKQKEDLKLLETDSKPKPSLFSRKTNHLSELCAFSVEVFAVLIFFGFKFRDQKIRTEVKF